MLIIDKYAYSSKLANKSEMAKFIFAMLLIVLSVGLSNDIVNTFIIFFNSFLTVFVGGMKLRNYIRVYKIPFIFIFLSCLLLVFGAGDKSIFTHSIPVFSSNIGIIKGGEKLFINVFLRSLAAISSTFFLCLNTPMVKLIKVFKRLRLPSVLIELLILVYRFIFIFIEEATIMLGSLEIRFAFISNKKAFNAVKLFVATLFKRVMEKNADMAISLDIKFYNGNFPV